VKYSFAQVRKAVAAAILAGAAVLVSAAQKGSVDQTAWVGAVVAAIVAGASVFLIPNAPATAPALK
jgi:uncharacterized NAD-dependent epimerase/dehydratase family protein